MYAAIDLGSNSFRLQVGEYKQRNMHVITRAREPNRLAKGLDPQNHLMPKAVQAGLKALENLAAILEQYPLNAVRAVATSTLRHAVNADEFIFLAKQIFPYPIDIITGEEEGRLIYLGVANVLDTADETRFVIDIGGGSTELIAGKGHLLQHTSSLNIGTVNQTQLFFREGMLREKNFEEAISFSLNRFQHIRPVFQKIPWKTAYGSSGTIRAIADILLENGIGDSKLTQENLLALKRKMIKAGTIQNLQFKGLKRERAETVVGGLSILIALMQVWNMSEIQTINAGLRMGIIWDMHLKAVAI